VEHPPKPRFALSVGIVGHRPNRLPGDAPAHARQGVVEALAAIRTAAFQAHARHVCCFADGLPLLTLISALAEGADSMAATAALAAGYALDIVLPFERGEYAKDFEGAAKAAFGDLLGRGHAILELGGTRADEGKSYEAAGLALLDTCDILIAVWDGKPPAGRGGTAELVAEAGRRGMPVVLIDVHADTPAPTRIVWPGLEAGKKVSTLFGDHAAEPLNAAIDKVVDAVVRPPENGELDGLNRFLRERYKGWIRRCSFPVLMMFFFVRRPRWTDFHPRTPKNLTDGFLASDPRAPLNLAEAFGWADAIGIYFAQMFRSTFIFNFVATALAVAVAALSLLPPFTPFRSYLAIAELALIGVVLYNIYKGLSQHWHQRWLEPREVAERLRIAFPMTMLGTRTVGPYGETQTWTSWYARALLREAGLRPGNLNAQGLEAVKASLDALLVDQSKYQDTTAWRFEKLNGRIAFVGAMLLVGTFIAVFAHLFILDSLGVSLLSPALSGVLESLSKKIPEEYFVVISTALPALGAAFFGIRTIGDFEGSAKRAKRMRDRLDGLSATLKTIDADFHSYRAFSHLAADVMLGDVASWRLSAESRGLAVG
jgi:hypothetical protein